MKTDWDLSLKFDPNKKMFFSKSLPREMEVLNYDFIERSDLLRIETIMWMLFGEEGARRTYDYVERLRIIEPELGRFKIYLEI
jgi:trehalose/maltose hydrolase-like predicted phosphorylase